MAVYNGERHLHATLESILQQRDVTFELIVVNDGSTDTSMAILDKFAKKDSRLRIYDQENRGLTRSLIRGCAEAQGEFIARQDVGDVSLQGRLAKQVVLLQNNPDVDLVGCDYSLVTPYGEILSDNLPSLDAVAMTQALRGESDALFGPHHGTVMFRKSAFTSAGGYRDAFYYAQDLDLWTRMAEFGELAFVSEVLCRTQFATNSLSGRFRKEQQQLKSLISEAMALRHAGMIDDPVLEQARHIRQGTTRNATDPRGTEAAAAYFIGSCLVKRGDPAAHSYFRRAISLKPFYLRAWLKMLYGALRSFSGGITAK